MATDDAAKATGESVDGEPEPVNQSALTMSKHLTAWRETYGDDLVDEAVRMSDTQRKADAKATDPKPADAKASAAEARAQAGQQREAAPAGRSTTDPKGSAKT